MVSGLDVNRSRLAWFVGGGVIALAVLFVVYSFVGTFVFGVFIYYATRPVYRRMNKRVGDRRLAAAISLFTLALPVLILFSYALLIGLQELNTFVTQYQGANLGDFQRILGPYINLSTTVDNPDELLQHPGEILNQPGLTGVLQAIFDQGLGVVSSVGGFVGNALLHLFIMISLAYYLLVDGRRLSRWFQSMFADDRGVMDQFVANVDRDFENIFFGNILNAILTGVIGALVYSLLDFYVAPAGVNIPYAALVGLLTGAGSLVPVVGMKIVYFPVTLYLAVISYQAGGTGALWFPALFAVVSFVVVDVVPDLGLRPYVSGRNLHTGAVMLAYIFGPILWGWYGLFLGPILLILATHFGKVVVPELVAERTFAPYSIDPGNFDTLGAEREVPTVADGSDSTDESIPGTWDVPEDATRDGDDATRDGDDGAPMSDDEERSS